jgi:hypothetical protein
MNSKTYMLRALLFSFLAALAVVAVNSLVDPYGIVGTPRVSGLNEYKVDINEHSQLMKKYQPLFDSHNALIVGNSRVELGIRPSHPCFSSGGMSVYNLGVPGADVRTQLEYALNLIYQQPVKTIFLSVDFTDFISPALPRQDSPAKVPDNPTGEFRYTFDGTVNPDYHLKAFKDYLKSLFSLDALISSVKTVMLQSHTAPDRDAAGFNPARDFEEAVRVEGPQALFGQKMSDLRAKYSKPWYLKDPNGHLNPAFEDLDQFLSIVEERGIKVYLFTNPFHEDYWDLFRTQGHMPAYEDWMRSMEELVQRHRGSGNVEFWDFSVDSSYVHEPVPEGGVKSGPLQWFWEPAHYRRQLGDLMVDAMLSEQCGSEVAFGRQIF